MKSLLTLFALICSMQLYGQSCPIGNVSGYQIPVIAQITIHADGTKDSCWYWNRDEIMDYVADHGGGGSLPMQTYALGSSFQLPYTAIVGGSINNGDQLIGDVTGATGTVIAKDASNFTIDNVSGSFDGSDATYSVVATPEITCSANGPASANSNFTISDSKRGLIYNPAGSIGSAIITLNPNPTDGQEEIILFGGTIKNGGVIGGLNINTNGSSKIGFPNSAYGAAANTQINLKYIQATDTWYIACINCTEAP